MNDYVRRDVVLDLIDCASRNDADGWTAVRHVRESVQGLDGVDIPEEEDNPCTQ